jgi:hypothetical protein
VVAKTEPADSGAVHPEHSNENTGADSNVEAAVITQTNDMNRFA